MIPIYKPFLKPYKASAIKAIESEWISNHGIYVDLAAAKLRERLNIPYCILMNNGTSATHCLLKALHYKHPSIRKLYVPNYVFIAPLNCALMEFDSASLEVLKTDPETMNMDTSETYIRSLEPNSAVLVVHNLGNIVNVPRLHRLRPDIVFLEDNCEGLFGTYEGMYTGAYKGTLCSAVSFYGNKSITTGEGGAFFTHDLELYKYMKTFYSHGMSETRYVHNMLGTNYRMTNVQAAFLYDQLNDLDTILQLKRAVFQRYTHLLQPLFAQKWVKPFLSDAGCSGSNWMYVLQAPALLFDDLEKWMQEKNIQIRPLFYDVGVHQHLRSLRSEDSSASAIQTEHGFMLPSYPELRPEDQEYIVQCLREYCLLRL